MKKENNNGCMVVLVGAGYTAIGFLLLCKQLTIASINLDIRFIPNLIFACTISSFLFALSDFLEQIFIEYRRIKNLKTITLNDFVDELSLHKLLFSKQNEYFNVIEKILMCVINCLYCIAFVVGVILVFIRFSISDIILAGLTLASFGLIISAYGYREMRQNKKQSIIDDIWLQFYKNQASIET